MSNSSAGSPGRIDEPVVTTAVALIIAFIVADKFPVVGKFIMHNWNLLTKAGQPPTGASITEASLVVLFVFSFGGIAFGTYMAKRRWVTYKQVMLSMFTALFTALFAIVDQSIPDVLDETRLSFGSTVYYLGWPTALYFLAPAFLPRMANSQRWVTATRLMAVSCLLAVCCWAAGGLLGLVGRFVHGTIDMSGPANLSDPVKFWVLNPSTVSPIAGAAVVIVLAPLWWRSLWADSPAVNRWAWVLAASSFVVLYAGLYGRQFYATRGWAATLIDSDIGVSSWHFFRAFAAYAGAVLIAVGLCVFVTKRTVVDTIQGIGWPIGGSFWWRLPLFLGCAVLGAVVWSVIPLVNAEGGASAGQVAFLCVAHLLHGATLGFALQLPSIALRMVPHGRMRQTDSGGGAAAGPGPN